MPCAPRRNIFLLLAKSEHRKKINEILDGDLPDSEKDAQLRPLMTSIGFSEYQQWKAATAKLKEKLPFLKNIEDEASESIVLEIVHDQTLKEETKEKLLKKILPADAFEKYKLWRPSNIALTPDSFLNLLDNGLRGIAQRRLGSKDFDALDIFMEAVGGDSYKIYSKWKKQMEKQGNKILSQVPTSLPLPAEVKVETPFDLNTITEGETIQSYTEMLEKLTQKRDEIQESMQWAREKTALVEVNGGQVCAIPTAEQISMITHLQGAHMAAASLAKLAEAVWRQKPGENFELSVEHTTVRNLKNENTETTAEELREQFRMDALNTSLANEILLETE